MNYEQMTESILAQKDKPLLTKEQIANISGNVLRGLGATAFICLALQNIGEGYDAHNDAVQSRESAHQQEQDGNLKGAENAARDAERFENARNADLGFAGLQLFSAIAPFSIRSNRKNKEVMISGEKPTEQTKE